MNKLISIAALLLITGCLNETKSTKVPEQAIENSENGQGVVGTPPVVNTDPPEEEEIPPVVVENPSVPEVPPTEVPPVVPVTPETPPEVVPEIPPVVVVPEVPPVVVPEVPPVTPPVTKPVVTFEQLMTGVLKARCVRCHSGALAAEGVDLSKIETVLLGRAILGDDNDSAPEALVVPGKPDESLLWKVIESGRMPLGRALTEDQKNLFKSWIETGANP